MNLSVCKYYS